MKPLATYQKLRGGYYTPKLIADFLAHWAIQTANARVLEPSCGDGTLLQSATETLLTRGATLSSIINQLQGIEFDPQEAIKARTRLAYGSDSHLLSVHNGDFFAYSYKHLANKEYFDAIIGNPPFIRYQNFPEEQRQIAFYFMQQAGLHPSRLTNVWVPFLVTSTLLLTQHGRLAMVIPAELLQVNYAAELRSFLSRYYTSITLVTFKKLVFDDIQQEVVLLLAERNGHLQTGIRTLELDGINALVTCNDTDFSQMPLKEMDHSTEKWTMYFLEAHELQLLRTLRERLDLTRASSVIDVDVGIVTGLNNFFVLTAEQVERYQLTPHTQRIVGRSAQLTGLRFIEQDWQKNVADQAPSFLLTTPDMPFYLLPEELKKYIIPKAKRRVFIRDTNAVSATAGMLCHRYGYHRHLCYVRCINIQRLFLTRPVQPVLILFIVSKHAMDTLHAQEKLPLPLVGAEHLCLDDLNTLLRSKGIYAVLDITDRLLLQEGMGLSIQEIQQLRTIWEKLRDRRINRKPDTTKKKSPPLIVCAPPSS